MVEWFSGVTEGNVFGLDHEEVLYKVLVEEEIGTHWVIFTNLKISYGTCLNSGWIWVSMSR